MSEPEELIRAQAAQIDRLRAELAEQYTRHAVVVMSRDKAEAAIARVRAQIAVYTKFWPAEYAWVHAVGLLRALDGAE